MAAPDVDAFDAGWNDDLCNFFENFDGYARLSEMGEEDWDDFADVEAIFAMN